MTIDPNKPLETITGKPVTLVTQDGSSMPFLVKHPEGICLWHRPDGTCPGGDRAIRNVPEPTAPPMYDRLVKLAERVATPGSIPTDTSGYTSCIDEARAIMAELRPVDPDVQAARDIVADQYLRLNPDDTVGDGHRERYANFIREGAYDDTEMAVSAALAAIKRGRELAVQP